MSKGKNYINNKVFTEALESWTKTPLVKKLRKADQKVKAMKKIKNKTEAQLKEQEKAIKAFEKAIANAAPTIPDYAAMAFMQIAERRARASNFKGYTYKEDMIGEGIVSCVRYAYNFDASKAGRGGAFAYFSQFIFNAFIAFINRENKLRDYKFETIRDNVEGIEALDYTRITKSNRDKQGNYIDHYDDSFGDLS